MNEMWIISLLVIIMGYVFIPVLSMYLWSYVHMYVASFVP